MSVWAMQAAELQAEHHATKDTGGKSLLSFGLLERSLPVDRTELQHAVLRPTVQKAEGSSHAHPRPCQPTP